MEIIELQCMPRSVYNETVEPLTGRVSKLPIQLSLPLPAAVAAEFAASPATMMYSVYVECLLADNTPPRSYDPMSGTLVTLNPPHVESVKLLDTRTLNIRIKRMLPVSACFGNSPMRLIVTASTCLFVTNAFYVGAKGHLPLHAPMFTAFPHVHLEDTAAAARDAKLTDMVTALKNTSTVVFVPINDDALMSRKSARRKRKSLHLPEDETVAELLVSLSEK